MPVLELDVGQFPTPQWIRVSALYPVTRHSKNFSRLVGGSTPLGR
jgi:hypothetical protein